MALPGACTHILQTRQKKDGLGTVENPERFFNQDFQQLKQYCLSRQVRYIDEMFPPDRRSIGQGVLTPSDLQHVTWLRPGKLVSNPSFTVDGVSRFDFGQGMIGNCWFLASIGALTFQNDILQRVVPLGQTFDEDYCGLFHFRFWRFGRWVDVVIDDKLPTVNGRLLFVHSKDPTEFWPALLEKAYAKVCGSYSDMNAGTPAEALVDFTGGVHMSIQLSDHPQNLWELMYRAGKSKSLMGCGTPQGETSANTVLPNGLVQGHAYTVTGVKQLMNQNKLVSLVRLWNPWGEGEWKGNWSDGSPLWKTVSPEDRDLCLSQRDDGEFWMTLDDFCDFYQDLDICCLCPDFLDDDSGCHWTASCYEGRWVAESTAGGCMNNIGTFWTNPQYRVKIDKLNSECSEQQGDKNMLVSLMQKPDKRNRLLVKNLHIGFSVFKVPEKYKTFQGKFPTDFFHSSPAVAQTKSFINAREVMELIALDPGEYLIVPSTFNPNETASFILTILSKAETHVHEHCRHDHMEHMEDQPTNTDAEASEDYMRTLFRQFSQKYEEVDAELLQRLLNENISRGGLKSGGFGLDDSRSMVALMDTSLTGKLNPEEFAHLWKRITKYKDIFSRTDVSKAGALSLSELRNAIVDSGKKISNDMLNLMALRYGSHSGGIKLENFICLAFRLDCMTKLFNRLSERGTITLRESEWIYLSMYT